MTAQSTLDRLKKADNFKVWSFGRLQEALSHRDKVERLHDEEGALPPSLRSRLVKRVVQKVEPWDGEPDKVQWIDPATGYDCLIVRNHLGALCGYIGVPPSHPLHMIDYSTCPKACGEDWCEHTPESSLSVHGGLTFSNLCQPGEPIDGICHRAMDGRPDNVWWFGFDTAHGGDMVPGMSFSFNEYGEYRNLEYVVGEIEHGAQQLRLVELERDVTEVEIKQAVQSITSDGRPD